MTTEHHEELNRVTDDILAYVDNIFIIKSIYDTINNEHIMGIASPYLNFRDALFHYVKMYDAASKGEVVVVAQQTACIEEHLNRGIRDFAINLCSNYFIPVIHELMKDNSTYISDNVFQRLRHVYHKLKDIVAEIRLGGQKLIRFDNNDVDWLPRMITTIQDFDSILGEFSAIKRLYDIKSQNIDFYYSPNKPKTL